MNIKIPSIKVPNAAKMPKAKAMPKATDKSSVFFKKEEFKSVKHPSIEKLKDFLSNKSRKQQS